jgi:hypothetical protein
MPFRKNLKRIFHRDKSRSPGPSRPDTPDQLSSTLGNINITSNAPPPVTPDHAVSPHLPNVVASPTVLVGTTPIASTQTVTVTTSLIPPAPNVPSITVWPASNPTVNSALPGTPPIESPSQSVLQNVKHTTWSGLKTFLGLLNESADAFGPLKSAVGGINRCIEIFEVRST